MILEHDGYAGASKTFRMWVQIPLGSPNHINTLALTER